MIATNLEQSNKIIELGIDPNTADMCYTNASVKGVNYTDEFELTPRTPKEVKEIFDGAFHDWNKLWTIIPAWSLSALLNVLPYPQLSKDKLGGGKEGWMVSAYPDNCRYDSCWHDNPIDACVEMIVKLKEIKLL